jgi:hypothetical protein
MLAAMSSFAADSLRFFFLAALTSATILALRDQSSDC